MKLIFAVLYVSLNDGPYTFFIKRRFLHLLYKLWVNNMSLYIRS